MQGVIDGLSDRGHSKIVFVEYHPVKRWPRFAGGYARWDLVPFWLRKSSGYFGRFWQRNQTTHHDNVFGQGSPGAVQTHGSSSSRACRRSAVVALKSTVANRLRLWFDLYLLHRLVGLLTPGDKVFVVGADVLDGAYTRRLSEQMLAFAHLAAVRGCEVRILGFSIRPDPNPAVMALFHSLDKRIRYFVRDPNSLRRFVAMTGCDATLVADAAFMLEPRRSVQVDAVVQWIAEARKQAATVMAVNCNPVLVKGLVCEEAASVYRRLLLALSGRMPDICFVLVPHSSIEHEAELASDIASQLACHGVRVLALPLLPATEVKFIMGQVDLCVTGRMHVAIATLGMHVPVIGFSYGGKFEGLFTEFGIGDSVVDPRELINAETFVNKLAVLIRQRDMLRYRIVENAFAMFAKARLNVGDMAQ